MPRAYFFKRLFRRRTASFGAVVVAVFVLTSVFAPFLTPYSPTQQSKDERLVPPALAHWLGTDQQGRDILTRIVYGGRISLVIAVSAVAIGGTLGAVIGLVAGHWGGRTDQLLMRLMDVMMAFPTLFLAIAIVVALGTSLFNIVVAVALANTPQFARVLRGEVLKVRAQDYVTAARAMAASNARIIFRHLLPNVLTALIVLATMRVSVAILAEASLSFLGLGVPPPIPAWGSMAADGQKFLLLSPWVSIAPGAAIALLVLGFNLLGDGMRDALDPRLRGEAA